MNSNPSENWPTAELQFRLACEECHQRKIRCDLPPDDSNTTICNACRTNKRRCLFSIKSKTGRPRKPTTANGGLASAARPRQRHGLNGPAAEHVHVTSMHESARPPRMYRPSTAPPPSPPFVDTPETLAGSGNGQQPWLLSPSPPVTGGTFGVAALHEFGQQDQKRLFEGIFMDDFAFSAPDQSGSPAVPAETELTEVSEPEINARLPHTAPSPPVSSSTRSEGWLRRDTTDTFTETLDLCTELHRACHGRPLNFLCSADQEELASVLRVINDLGRKTHALTTQASRKQSPGSRDQYNWNIIHVSVAQAIELAADLIQFNLGLLAGQKGGEGAAFEQHDSRSSRNGDERGSSGDSHRRTDLVGTRRGGDAAARDMRLESVLALVRLDYSLNQFTPLVGGRHGRNDDDDDVAALDELPDTLPRRTWTHAGCGQEEGREPHTRDGSEWDVPPAVCPCCAGVSVARIKHVRGLGQTLVARLRSVW